MFTDVVRGVVEQDRGRVPGTRGRPDHPTPVRAPNCNAYAERFVRSIKEECLNRVLLFGERHLRRAIAEFVAHYHGQRMGGMHCETWRRSSRQIRFFDGIAN
jgi:predicted metalloprotease with PDZ domain